MAREKIRDELVTVATFENVLDASLAQQCLKGAGIDAFLTDQSTVSMAWYLSGALGGVKLSVAARDVEEASSVLKEVRDGELEVEEDWANAEAGAEGKAEDEDVTEPPRSSREQVVDRALKSLALSLLLMPLSLYTAWLLMDVACSEGVLGAAYRRRAIGVAVATAIQLGVFLFLSRIVLHGALAP